MKSIGKVIRELRPRFGRTKELVKKNPKRNEIRVQSKAPRNQAELQNKISPPLRAIVLDQKAQVLTQGFAAQPLSVPFLEKENVSTSEIRFEQNARALLSACSHGADNDGIFCDDCHHCLWCCVDMGCECQCCNETPRVVAAGA